LPEARGGGGYWPPICSRSRGWLSGLALASVVYGINMFGDAVRDLLDPRLRGGIGRYGVRAKKELKKPQPLQATK